MIFRYWFNKPIFDLNTNGNNFESLWSRYDELLDELLSMEVEDELEEELETEYEEELDSDDDVDFELVDDELCEDLEL